MKKPAVVLVSGGLDSTTCIAIALDQGFEVIPLSFSYGQRHSVELECAKRVVASYGIETHHVIDLGFFRDIGGSALTSNLDVPRHERVEDLSDEIPVTYVPARNLVFLSHATAMAEVAGSQDLFIGVNALDYSGYPDCRPEFIEQFSVAANLATACGVGGASLTVHTPLMQMTKAEIVQCGTRLGAPFELTHSCYAPTAEGESCGQCDSCLLRLKGFEEAGVSDPVRYVTAVS